jgi:tripartite-type tricarboxylate transporter receptor subunit TctC
MQDIVFTGVGDSPEKFAAFIKSEIEKWGKIVRETGLTAN